MTRASSSLRFRQRKLSTKQSLSVVRENQIDSIEDDAQRSIPQIDTGVERQEEVEHHLQAAINASKTGKAAQVYIPTPDASKTVEQYEKLYPKRFSQPTSYIRFSSTVEECNGASYCMDSEDDEFLTNFNSTRRTPGTQCSEDTFEEVMQFFESTVTEKQPYLAVDVTQIMTFEEMEFSFGESSTAALKIWAKLIYPYWRERRLKNNGHPIMPSLKFEQGQDKDDGDPYVCFRRREVRQVRKTRRTDAQSAEKLKKLRQEMELGRGIISDTVKREQHKKALIIAAQNAFETRYRLKMEIRKHGLHGFDEDLYDNSKRQKTAQQAAQPTTRPQNVVRPGTELRSQEADLSQLAELTRKKNLKWAGEVQIHQKKRMCADEKVADLTQSAITSVDASAPPQTEEGDYRKVACYFLPSPSPSPISGSPMGSPVFNELPIRPADIFSEGTRSYMRDERDAIQTPSYRQRVGRGGRIVIDRIIERDPVLDNIDPLTIDYYRFDRRDDPGPPYTYDFDPHQPQSLQFRARMRSPPAENIPPMYQRRMQQPTAEQLAAYQQMQQAKAAAAVAAAAAAVSAPASTNGAPLTQKIGAAVPLVAPTIHVSPPPAQSSPGGNTVTTRPPATASGVGAT